MSEGGRREGRGGEEGVKLTKTMQFYHLLIFIIHLFFIMIDYRVSFIKKLQIDSSCVFNLKIRITLVYLHKYLYLPGATTKLIKTITKF